MVYLEKPKDFKSKFDVVSCLFEYDGKILLLHRQDHKPQGNTWGVPAGKVENNENILDAMVREIEEETTFKILKNNLDFIKTVFVEYPEYGFVFHMYKFKLKDYFEVKINEKDHKSFKWVSPKEALTIDLIPDLGSCIKLAYNLWSK
jgi:8-oxo-dGTP diphosphatase